VVEAGAEVEEPDQSGQNSTLAGRMTTAPSLCLCAQISVCPFTVREPTCLATGGTNAQKRLLPLHSFIGR
jgi:hypothetical protein